MSWLISTCASTSQRIDALLAVPLKKYVIDGVIPEVIGGKVTSVLAKGQKVKLSNSLGELSLLTERQNIYSWNGPVLAIYPDKKLLDKIDGLVGVTHVLVIPWISQDVNVWINTWSAYELGSTVPKSPKKLISNPVVIQALKTLTSTVNLSTGIGHPSDKAATIDLFQHLSAAGESFDPKEVRAWLVSEGHWRPEDADKVKGIAEAVLSGRKLRGGTPFWRADIVAQWRERARQNQGSDT